MGMIRKIVCALIPAFALLTPPVAPAQESDEGKAGISLRIRPSGPVLAGSIVEIEGMTPVDAQGPLRLTVKLPSGESSPLSVNPAANGDYSLRFSNTDATGRYEIQARSPGGTSSGSTTFEVVVYDEIEVLEEAKRKAKQEVAEIGTALTRIESDIDSQIVRLPNNPAREELQTRWQALKPQLRAAVRDFGEIDTVLAPIRSFTDSDPSLKPLLRLPAQQLADWTKKTGDERQRIVNQLAASRRANVTCEQLERVIESFHVAAALVGMITEPFSLVTEPLKELAKNLGSQVGDGVLLRLGLKSNRQSTLKTNLTKLKDRFEARLGESNIAAAKAIKGQSNLIGKLGEVSAWLAGKVFDKYCERFAGPFNGEMHAEFFTRTGGRKWWEYKIRFRGQLELRYAKSGMAGAATTVNGEFTGQAVNFSLWEDAIRLGWPGLTSGAMLFKRAVVPKPWLAGAPLPTDDKPIEIEGKGAAAMVKPYGFSVPVQGEIVDDVLTLRIQPAAHDYSAQARVVYVVISPLSLVPVATAFELPYKEAGFFFLRASGGEPVKLKISHGAKSMKASDTIENSKGSGVSKGRYRLQFDLCNPAGKC
jgi:hypothetical protein